MQAHLAACILAGAIVVLYAADCRFAAAQSDTTRGVLADGNIVVTGFSGVQLPALIKPGTDPAEKATVNLNGPALRVIDVQAPGGAPQAQALAAAKPFTATASQIGQVFGVTLDGAAPPNIYVAATSVYGLPIVVPDVDNDGVPDRWEEGTANARFMPGLFGPAAPGGGPGSIWRIDGATGAVRLFANVALGGVPNAGPALGGLAFDPASSTLLVADRETGMVHRFDLNGAERGRYDHGIQGRTAAGLPPAPFDPGKRLVITRPPFQPANPESWGYAPPQRRIFGLAARAGRLYYAVADGLQIWSVAIAPDGSFGADARIEIAVPPGPSASEISRIAFDDQGRMLLAERVAPTGAFDFAALTEEGGGRVLRYAQLPSATRPAWQAVADEYAIGFSATMRGGNGGVAIGYGYDAAGRLDRNACGGFVWSSGEQLRVAADAAFAARLAAGGSPNINGLQGNGIDLVRPANAPPLQSYFADYDDQFDDPKARGHVGDVAIRRDCVRTAEAPLPAPLGLPGVAAPAVPADGQVPAPPGPPGLPPGPPAGPPGLPPGPPAAPAAACPAGTHQEPGFLCCPPYMKVGPTGQCKSPCANPAVPAPAYGACFLGFAPSPILAPFDPATTKCWNGSNAVKVGPAPLDYKCPAPPDAACPAGQLLVKGPPQNPVTASWSDATCQVSPQQLQCPGGQQIGLDGKCQNLCPAAAPGQQWAWSISQCCPVGTVAGPDGKCAPPQAAGPVQVIPPQTLPVEPAQPATPGDPVIPPPPPADTQPAKLLCPAGFAEKPALKCCAQYMHIDANNQCQSPCASGAKDPVSVKACHFGYAEPKDPVSFNPLTSPCWDGSKPLVAQLPGGGGVTPSCPAPPNAACSLGYTKVPSPKGAQPLVLTWSNFTCEPTSQQQKCPAGQQAGFDGQCHQLCGADERAWLTAQCCPANAAVTFDGKCAVQPVQVFPAQTLPAEPAQPAAPGVPAVPAQPAAAEAAPWQPLLCEAGTTLEKGFKCCAPYLLPGATGQCQTVCSNGANDQISVQICYNGFAPPTVPPITWTPGNAKCWDGSNPVMVAGVYKCPKPPTVTCPAGQQLMIPLQAGSGTWTDGTCGPTAQQMKCAVGQQVGLDGTCQQICPAGQTAQPINQCCPAGSAVTPDGKCSTWLPGTQLPEPPKKIGDPCPPGYKPLANGFCCLMSQVTASGFCCPGGEKPDPNGRTCSPRCTDGRVWTGAACACPPGTVDIRGSCLKPPGCGGDKVRIDGKCVCPEGTRERRGRCVPRETPPKIEQMSPDLRPVRPIPFCTRGKVLADGRCVCPQGTVELRGGCAQRLTPPPPPRPVPPQAAPTFPQRPPPRPPGRPPAQQFQQMNPELLPARPLR